ncbi:unnamed protein product [Brassica napus]|uniref:(rape) hypothetical protein n=1 Tax=Brassica napus TaxID=3708 RepID=A0A816LYQ2_BRANA|nr:unnamed protein product [Brassica napus]
MLIFWDVLAPRKLEIWCAEVCLERHKDTCQIRGNILWSEPVMTLDPPPPHQLHCHILCDARESGDLDASNEEALDGILG